MSGPTQAQTFQVEALLRSVGDALAMPEAKATPQNRSWRFDSRPVIAACFAIFVFAPGCAAAAVFLMRADATIPPIVTPESNPPFVTKSDRLPLGQWSLEAAESLGAKDATRLATDAALADPAFLAPILIRGSLEDGTLTTFAEPAIASEPIITAPRPRLRREVRRAKPPKLVAEITQPEPPPPTFFEKLFGQRFN